MLMVLLVVFALAATSCANLTSGTTDDEATRTDGGNDDGSTVSTDGADGDGADGADPAATCPDESAVLSDVNAATYAVYGETIVNTGGGPELVHFQIGTAWAAGRRLLVTNAHVTEAYVEFAEQGVQLERAIAIQAGTGTVVTLLRELTHPDYDGDPLGSPDVGLFTTQQELPTSLTLADPAVDISLGDEVSIVGFPGDVTDFIEIVPGETVPQATSLNGDITALRTHDDTEAVTPENLDVIQHQVPTTPGTSGSSMVSCGEVIGINNAGTVNLVAAPLPDGSLTIERQAAASNNFGVHVRHIDEMIGLFEDNALQGNELPVEAEAVASAGDTDMPLGALNLVGDVLGERGHGFEISVAEDGTITGTSTWANNSQFGLSGQIDEDGRVFFLDDAPELNPDLPRGFYEGEVVSETRIEGVYYEEGVEEVTSDFFADLQ